MEAHNAGYINDRKILVKEARMKGEFRPMGESAEQGAKVQRPVLLFPVDGPAASTSVLRVMVLYIVFFFLFPSGLG